MKNREERKHQEKKGKKEEEKTNVNAKTKYSRCARHISYAGDTKMKLTPPWNDLFGRWNQPCMLFEKR